MEVELGSKVKDANELQELGFDWLSQKSDICRRLAIAYEHYKRISKDSYPEVRAYSNVVSLAGWAGEVPPDHVLTALKEAKDRKCFEKFEIYSYRKNDDPILMGTVSSEGRWKWQIPFVITHWGGDIDPSWLEKNTR